MMNQSHILPGSVSKARWDHLNYYAISNGKMIASKSPQAGATPRMDIFQLLGNGMAAKMLMR
ncbi:hypothetical protein FOLKNPGA_00893 [Legionella sp. PC1000]|nr:hypothetical protein FOLKNPGA_00893 [Legionella sp. PC1000]